MTRTRISTTVDHELLSSARAVTSSTTDAALIDQALRALLAQHRRTEIDESYSAYDAQPLAGQDEWGDLETFHDAAATS